MGYEFSNEPIHAYFDERTELDMGPHHHIQNELIFVKSGSCTFEISGKQYIMGKNQIMFINAFQNHSPRVLELPYRRYVLTISLDLYFEYIRDKILASAFMNGRQQPEAVTLVDGMPDEIERHFQTMVSETGKKLKRWQERCSCLLLDMLVLINREFPDLFLPEDNTDDINLIFHVRDYLNEHYNEELDLDVVSKKFFINKYYLSHQFKNLIGYGFKRYLQLLRINRAKIFLQNSDMSVSDICSKVGYNNINYFISLFKEKESMTPLQYRKLHFKKDPS